jgi:hypothetical protein
MPRRCLECDHIYAALRTCPKCGSERQLYLPAVEPGPDPIFLNAWLGLAHPLMMTGVTLGQPGIGLGTAFFAEGLCAALILVGTEKAQRGMAPVWAIAGFVQLTYALLTDQSLAMGLGAAVSFLACFHALPWQNIASGIALIVGWVTTCSMVIGILLFALQKPLPGWWTGEHPPLISAGKIAVEKLATPQHDLPANDWR